MNNNTLALAIYYNVVLCRVDVTLTKSDQPSDAWGFLSRAYNNLSDISFNYSAFVKEQGSNLYATINNVNIFHDHGSLHINAI